MSETKTQITRYLADFSKGDPKALEELTPLVYPYLKQVARGFLRKEAYPGTLQPTALVNEAFLRLLGQHSPHFENRNHFFALVASFMRRVLVDRARRNLASKRHPGGPYTREYKAVNRWIARLGADGCIAAFDFNHRKTVGRTHHELVW